MEPSSYQLYAFEFYVQHLETSLDLANMRIEAKLFHSPYAILKSKMNLSQSLWVLKPQYVPEEEEAEDEEPGEVPFVLDLKSASSMGQVEEMYAEEGDDDFTDSAVDEVSKMRAYDPCETTMKDGPPAKKDNEKTSEPPSNPQESEANDQPQTLDEQGNESIELEDKRSQLRMFPDDPTGMPYNKVRKGMKAEEGEETLKKKKKKKLQDSGKELEVAEEEVLAGEEDEGDKSVATIKGKKYDFGAGDTDEEQYTIVEKKLKYLQPDEKEDIDDQSGPAESEKRPSKDHELPTDIFEAGVTIILPMKPLQMLHNLQRFPLHVRVCSEDNRFLAQGFLDLSPLFECVLRAERGPPTPVTSSSEVALHASGDFNAVLYSVIRLYAFGKYAIRKIKSREENPNEELSHYRPPERPLYEEIDKDIQKAPAVVSSPEHLPRASPRPFSELEEEIKNTENLEDDFYAENIVYCPIHRIVTPQPKDTYETLRWKIDKMLGLTEFNIEEYQVLEKDEEQKRGNSKVIIEEEELDELQLWSKKNKKDLRSKWKRIHKCRNKTRTILQKILMGIEKPDPIRSKPGEMVDDRNEGEHEEEGKTEQQEAQLTAEELKKNKTKFMFEEIRRQQQEERMIKHYKRAFRMMLRVLESERGVSIPEQKLRQKQRKHLQDLLSELETYAAEDVEMAFIKVSKEKMKCVKKRPWDVDLWPTIPEEEGEVELDEEIETEDNRYPLEAPKEVPGAFLEDPGDVNNVDLVSDDGSVQEEISHDLEQ